MPKPIALPFLFILLITLLVKFPNEQVSQLKRIPIECLVTPAFADSLEEISINDNRKTAGVIKNGVLSLDLEVRAGIWYPESHDGKGLRVYAFAERGKSLQLPGPFIRVPEGTIIRASIHNLVHDAPLVLHGLHSRPQKNADSILIPFDQTVQTEFKAGAPGTYFYKASTRSFRTGDGNSFFNDSQLYGAFVIDPPNKKFDSLERIMVIGLWNDTLIEKFTVREEKVINGLTWPFTEQLTYQVNEPVSWRVINASNQPHPMHLHGFYYTVKSRGTQDSDHIYKEAYRYKTITELLKPGETMSVGWVPEREGNWLFHCHTLVHIMPESFLREQMPMDDHNPVNLANHALNGMGGIIIGIHVLPSSTPVMKADAVKTKERMLTLIAREHLNMFDTLPAKGFVLLEGDRVSGDNISVPGPPIVLTRNEPVAIKVINQLHEVTTVHWHGLEIESFFDGVSGWGNRGKELAPLLQPGDSFVVHMVPPRAGTFIYHTHAHNFQLFAGMYGAIIVLEPGEKFDMATDRVLLMSDGNTDLEHFDVCPVLLNGKAKPDPMEFKAGVKYRLRLVNITAFNPTLEVALTLRDSLIFWKAIAKDGAMFPVQQMSSLPARQIVTVGETRDYEWRPREKGDYTMRLREENIEFVKMILRVN